MTRVQEIKRPRQAVILAGGLGTRLRPLTDSIPKPMILINGRPFLAYLIDQLRENGFEEVLLLLGYKAEVIADYFKDGADFDLKIQYSISNIEDETGVRLKKAKSKINKYFFLMYCDNYWPYSFDDLWGLYLKNKWSAQVSVYNNTDGRTRDNMQIDQKGHVRVYDKSRTAAGLSGVDIGFLIANSDVLDLIPDDNVSFEATVYPALILQEQFGAYQSAQRYYSIGSLERLDETDKYLTNLIKS